MSIRATPWDLDNWSVMRFSGRRASKCRLDRKRFPDAILARPRTSNPNVDRGSVACIGVGWEFRRCRRGRPKRLRRRVPHGGELASVPATRPAGRGLSHVTGQENLSPLLWSSNGTRCHRNESSRAAVRTYCKSSISNPRGARHIWIPALGQAMPFDTTFKGCSSPSGAICVLDGLCVRFATHHNN